MEAKTTSLHPIGWVGGALVLAVGVANLIWVHPVPAAAYLLLSLVYFPPANTWLRQKTGLSIHWAVKAVLGVVLFLFTLGVSDLGDMIDKLAR